MSFIHSLKWSFFSELASKAIQPVVVIVLARLLTPEDYGVMNSAMMVIAFSQIFWDAGLGKALIQRKTDIDEASSAAFLINIALGIIIAALLYLFAKPIAQTFFHDERVTAVLQVMTLQVLFGALSSVQNALLQKEMGFKKLFWVQFATVSLPGLASIPLAMNGLGYWALVAGTLVGQLAQVIMLWSISTWRPRWTFKLSIAKEMWSFGVWVGISGLMVWFFGWADSLIVGYFLGLEDLGRYRLAISLANAITALTVSPVAPVLYSKLSLISKDIKSVKKLCLDAEKLTSLVLTLSSIIIILLGERFFLELIGEKWKGVFSLLVLLLVSINLAQTVSYRQEGYKAIGRPDIETKVMAISMLIRIIAYLFFIHFGLHWFLVGRIISVVMGTINHSVFSKIYLQIRYYLYLKNIWLSVLVLCCSCVCYFVLTLNDVFRIILIGTLLVSLILAEKPFLINIYSYVAKTKALARR